jgi:MoxR-like ATPase
LLKAVQVNALLEGRGFVLPEDVKKMVFKTLGHRIVLSYEAVAVDMTEDKILEEILKGVKVV